MKYIAISELSKYIGQTVTLQGWVHALRDQKHVQFLILRNRTGSVQVVHEKTGAQREHRPDVLRAQAREKGLDLGVIQFYLDFFKYGCPPHGGFGFGLSRLLMVMLGLPSVRDTTFLSRTPNRLHP